MCRGQIDATTQMWHFPKQCGTNFCALYYINRKESWIVFLPVSRHSCPIIDTTASADNYKLQGIGLIEASKRLNPASTSGYVGVSNGSILAVVHGKSSKPPHNVIPFYMPRSKPIRQGG